MYFGKESKISGRADLVKKLGKNDIALPKFKPKIYDKDYNVYIDYWFNVFCTFVGQ